MRITKSAMAQAIIQAQRRSTTPPSASDPDVMKLSRSRVAAELESDYKQATNSNDFRHNDSRRRS